MSHTNVLRFLVLCLLPLCARAEVADKLPTVQGLWAIALAVACVLGAVAFSIAYLVRWPWLAFAVPCLALVAALGPAIDSDVVVAAEQELGAAYVAQAEVAEWLWPLVSTMGFVAGMAARRRRLTQHAKTS
jgi:hypothetical protein